MFDNITMHILKSHFLPNAIKKKKKNNKTEQNKLNKIEQIKNDR